MVRLVAEGIEHRALLGGPRLLRFDDVLAVEDGRLVGAAGERLAAPAGLVAEVASILAGPQRAPDLGGTRRALRAWLGRPHGPRRAAAALLDAAARLCASDLHVEPVPSGAAVRVRLEGELADLCELEPGPDTRLLAALKGLAGCLPYRADVVQEGRIAREGVAADVRASFVPTAFGERAALRLFGRLRSLEQLGLCAETLAALRTVLAEATGLFLVAGPTGAGKTTTIYAALGHLAATRRGAHLSLEDPVEQRLRAAGIPVDQVELDPARGLGGEAMLAAALRQDVDVLAVGEVRTPAEASLALQAAHTGRLVLAGVHAGSCEEARVRMLDLGAEPKLLARTLRGVLHQELVVEPCACAATCAGGGCGGGSQGCPRCRGTGRTRRLRARLAMLHEAREATA